VALIVDPLDAAAAIGSLGGFVDTLVHYRAQPFVGFRQQWWTRLIQGYVDLAIRQACGQPDGLGGLAIFIPPQHGKSTHAAEIAPAAAFARNPDLRTLLLTYGKDFSTRAIKHCQGIMGAPAYKAIAPARFGSVRVTEVDEDGREYEHTEAAEDRASMMRILTDKGAATRGYYLASSPRSTVTGWGYDLGLLDDLVKNTEDALNPALRAKLEQAVKAVFFTRRSPTSSMVLIMTRWHHLDIAETLIRLWRAAGIPYATVRLPAIAVPDPSRPYDPRAAGEVLDAVRYGDRWYREQAALIEDPELWEALYQQNPLVSTGVAFLDEHWGRFDPEALRARAGSPPPIERLALSIDANNAPGGTSFAQVDVGAIVRVAGGEREAWKLAEVQGKWELRDFVREVLALAERWPLTDILIENAAAGPGLASLLRDALGPARAVAEPGTLGRHTYAVEVLHNKGKPLRLHLVPHGNLPKTLGTELASPYVTTGAGKLPTRSLGAVSDAWVGEHLREFREWPHGRNNDRVDTWGQFVRWAASNAGLRPRWNAIAFPS